MADSSLGVPSTTPALPHLEVSNSERRRRWFEVCLVLMVACGGYIITALFLLIEGPSAATKASNARYAVAIVQELSSLLLLNYVLSRRGLNFASIGMRWSLTDLGMGLLLTAFSLAAYRLGHTLVELLHNLAYGSPAIGPTARDFFAHPPIVAIPFTFLNGLFEELIVRAYLMTEVLELTGSAPLAVVFSVAVQFSYHLYYGWAGAISLSLIFLVSALYYVQTRRALPIVAAHGFFDLYSLARLW